MEKELRDGSRESAAHLPSSVDSIFGIIKKRFPRQSPPMVCRVSFVWREEHVRRNGSILPTHRHPSRRNA